MVGFMHKSSHSSITPPPDCQLFPPLLSQCPFNLSAISLAAISFLLKTSCLFLLPFEYFPTMFLYIYYIHWEVILYLSLLINIMILSRSTHVAANCKISHSFSYTIPLYNSSIPLCHCAINPAFCITCTGHRKSCTYKDEIFYLWCYFYALLGLASSRGWGMQMWQ